MIDEHKKRTRDGQKKGRERRDAAKALTLIRKKLGHAMPGQLAGMLCDLFGCPPVIRQCFGQQTCARCGAMRGDTLMGIGMQADHAVVGHDCEKCVAVLKALTPEQRLLTRVLP